MEAIELGIENEDLAIKMPDLLADAAEISLRMDVWR